MYGKIQGLFLLFMLWIAVALQAQQEPSNSEDLEDLLYRNESAIIPETIAGDYPESGPSHIDLNSISAEDLEASGLFTSYQIHELLKYREKYGPIYSIHELAAIPGFHPRSIMKIESFVSVNTVNIPEGKKPGRHMILINMERSFPLEEGFLLYAGSPLKSTIRIKSHPLKNLSMALTYEKDSGELFLYRNRPQFLSGYLSYEGKHFIKHMLVGSFQLNQGMGLVNGAGFMHRAGDFRVNQLSLSRIKPYASKTESMFEQGMVCKMGSNKFQLLLWASYHKFSLSPSAFTETPKPEKWLELQRTSGLYRTRAEQEARELAYRIHSGIQLLYRQKQLTVGIMHGGEWIGPSKKGLELLKEDPGPSLHHKVSLHANWYRRKIQISGELAASEFRSLAFLLCTVYHFNDFVQGSLLIHHYGARYQGSLPSSYGSGSKIRNEQGVALHLNMETGKNITAKFTGEVFRYPSPRYLTHVPSGGYRMDLTLQNPGTKMIQWRARVVSKTWQTTPADKLSKIRPLHDSRIIRFDGQLIYNHSDQFRWQSRLVIGYYSRQQNSVPAYAAVQQVTLATPRILKVTTQFVLFHVSDWENRIYVYEPGFYYSFNFPAYYGNGQKTTLLLTLKPVKGVSVSVKISGITNSVKRKWESGIQLRLSL